MERLRVALAGVDGVDDPFVHAVQVLAREGLVEVAAFVEPAAGAHGAQVLAHEGARPYADFAALLAAERVDIACIGGNPPDLYPLAMAAFARGAHVLTASPVASSIQDLHALLALQEAQDRFGAAVIPALTWPMALRLKRCLCEGELGTVRSIRAQSRCLKEDAYFAAHHWAGKAMVGDRYVLGGPLMTCGAPLLVMASYLAGASLHEFAAPVSIEAELYRTAERETEDTACLRAAMETGVEICVYVTRCAQSEHAPRWIIEGERASAVMDEHTGVTLPAEHISAELPEAPVTMLLRRLTEVASESDEPVLMPLVETEPWVLMVNGAYESSRRVYTIPKQYIDRRDTDRGPGNSIRGIDEAIEQGAATGRLFSEMGLPWAVRAKSFDVTDYTRFPMLWRT